MKFNFKSKKAGKQKTANLVYYDADAKLFYNNIGGSVTQYTKGANSKLRVSTLINFDSLLKTNVEVPKTTEDMDIEDFVIETAYKQLNIPSDASYEISYFRIETNFDADSWNYDVYAIETANLEKNYDDLLAKTQYIDVITSTAFLPLVLYRKNKLDLIGNHIFVYIGNNSSVFAFYSKGEPLYIKSLNVNVHRLRVEFNQETSLELSSTEFENFISGKSGEVGEHKASIDSMLDKISRDVEESILYVKRVYQELDPTALYFGMSIEFDEEFLPYFRDTFLIETKSFTELSFSETTKGANALADIAMNYGDYYATNPNSKLPNFSYAKRPKPLNQRECGQFVVVVAGFLVLSLLYPLYNMGMSGFFAFRGDMLQKEYDNVVFQQAEEYRAREKSMKSQIESLQKNLANVNKNITDVRNDMSDIHTWQTGYIQKSKVIDDILKVAIDSKVYVVKYTAVANQNHQLVIELNLFARNQQNISDFINKLNDKRVYRSVVTEEVKRNVSAEKGDGAQKPASTVKKVASAASNVANRVANAVGNAVNANTTIEPISAEYDLSTNAEIGSIVEGSLNSIVKVVVR